MISSLITQFGDSSSGIGALGINGSAFLIQLLTFIVVFLILRQWAFKPIIKLLNERRSTIEKGVQLGEQMQRDKIALEAKVAEALHKARSDADKIISEAQDAGRQAIQEAEEAARSKAEGLITQAGERIKQDTAIMRQRLEKDLAGMVSEATEAVLREKVDAKKDAVIIERALKESRQS